MVSPRPYVAAAAASVLAALYFVPSATASPPRNASSATSTASHSAAVTSSSAPASARTLGLADTGSIDTKPYVIGGAGFLVVGAGLMLNAGRRSRESLS